jgi:DNA-binding CsgD family transcriptional regulator
LTCRRRGTATNQAPHADGADAALRAVVDRSAGAGGRIVPPREEIVASWGRSALAGVRPERFEVPYDADVDDRSRFTWAAESVIDRVGRDLEGTKIGLLLTDQRAHVVARRAGDHATSDLLDRIQLAPGFVYAEEQVGTNAIGTALESPGPTLVEGQEHFAEALTLMACAAVTVTDPASGRVLGVVDLTCAAPDASPLMLPLVKRAAWEIEQRLLQDSSVDERMLQEAFLRARRSFRGPLVAVNRHTVLVNSAASAVVEQADREVLWDGVLRALRTPSEEPTPVLLAGGRTVLARSEPLMDGPRLVGAVLRLEAGDAGRRRAGKATAASRPSYGWTSLTDAELAVAEQVARGLTNREAAAHLYLSPHTIDFHLRQIFRKLGIRSRVELTRTLLEWQAARGSGGG